MFDATIKVIVALLAQDFDDPDELDIRCLLLSKLRESLLPAHRKLQPDLGHLSSLIKQKRKAAATR